ncbi:MAG: anhydro-N-acetylmuramic acid kinase [Rhodospirillaceae bacterium]|nr:anhydro-N-acetylmuramic acid kinase [Rhodospirillaceae bacterium]
MIALGLMSGTSLDGIDAALIKTDGEAVIAFGPRRTFPYAPDVRARIKSVFGRQDCEAPEVQEVVRLVTDLHAKAVQDLLADIPPDWQHVDLIGFHGQTLFHAPERGVTVQIGDGARLGRILDRTVVSDFRSLDVASGGQGAPLVPVYHRALVSGWTARPEGTARPSGPIAVLNVGGVANVTVVAEDGDMVACDTGPGNALIDDWVALHTGRPCDVDGHLAARGCVNEVWLAEVLSAPFFMAAPPKSLDRDAFHLPPKGTMTVEDGAATLTAFTVRAVAAVRTVLPCAPSCWVVCGGGRCNPVLMSGLRDALGVPVLAAEDIGWDGDALEAQAFGFLAVRAVRGLPISFPGTTGVAVPLPGGRIDFAGG